MSTAPTIDWASLFSAAGLDLFKWTSVTPTWTSPIIATHALRGPDRSPSAPILPMRIEAAAYRGKPSLFRVDRSVDPPQAHAAVPALHERIG